MYKKQYCWINQKGAGTGKTWSCVGLVREKPEFNTFIYLSKMNTAKSVIKEEFISQFGKHKIFFNGDVAELEQEENVPSSKIIVSTIDAMIYAFSNRDVMSYTRKDYFSELVYCFDINRPRFEEEEVVWNNVEFGPNTLIVIDECQDLEEGYIDKFMKNISTTGVSFYLMGDILQSVIEQNNIFEYLRLGKHLINESNDTPWGFHNTEFIRLDSSNDKIIRFHSKKFIDLANDIIEFEYFGANRIAKCCENPEKCGFKHDNEPQFLIETGDETTKFFSALNKLVVDNDYSPEDILVITPIVDTAFMYRLETEINEYWADKLTNGKCFQGEFCLLQTSKYGKIDLSISQGKTRILSIHAAKGMGGTCVILVNLLNKSLLSHQTKHGELKYESIIHVALTRQKENLLIYYGGYGAENVDEDILAKTILGVDNNLVMAPPQKRCIISFETLASCLKDHLNLINIFEEQNFLRYSLGKLGKESPFNFLEPIDLKINLMINTMMEVALPMLDTTIEFKYMKPFFKRLALLKDITVILSLNPIPYKCNSGCMELEIQDNTLGKSLLIIIDNIKKKLWPKEISSTPPILCPLESYIVLFLFQKFSPFTVQNVGNIYHRMAKSINQGYRAEYHNDKICQCLQVLDKTIIVERKDEVNPFDCEEEPLDILNGDDDDFFTFGEDIESQSSTQEFQTNPLDSLYSLLPEDGEIPESIGMTMLALVEDNFGYNPNFTIDLGMSDYFYTKDSLVVMLTIPYINYVNFMNDVTLPLMLYSYFIFKVNDHLQIKHFSLSHMFKQFMGMKQPISKLSKIIFYINRMDNNDRRVIEILRDDKFLSSMDPVIISCITKAFSNFVKSWINYYKTVRSVFNTLSSSEIDYIKNKFELQLVKDEELLEKLKDIPSDIVGQILDVINKKNFETILNSVIKRVVNDFVIVKV